MPNPGVRNIRPLRVMQLNANSIVYGSRADELHGSLVANDVDVCALQETMLLDSDPEPDVPGYQWIRSSAASGRRKGGVALLVADGVQFARQPIQTQQRSGVEVCAMRLRCVSRDVVILNVYCSTASPPMIRDVARVLDSLPRGLDMVLLGDFNAHHTSLVGPSDTPAGERLSTITDERQLLLINRLGEHSLLLHRSQPTTPDLALVSPRIAQNVTDWRIEDSVGSDHLPICFDIGNTVDALTTATRQFAATAPSLRNACQSGAQLHTCG